MLKNLKRFLSEPLIQFLVLGGLLYATFSFVQAHKDMKTKEIVIDDARVSVLVGKYQTEMGTLPSKQQLDTLVDNYVKEEIMYREARKMGLDADDEVIRRRLAQKYAFLHLDLGEAKPPTDEELQGFYKSHPELFTKDPTVSFSHIYFSTDGSTDDAAKERALAALQSLKSSDAQRAPEKGDRFPLQYDYTDQTSLDIRQNFGDTPFLQALLQAPVHTWVGPIQSGYGWHLLYITDRVNSTIQPYDVVKGEVQEKYLDARREQQNKDMFDRVSNQYIVRREYLDDAGTNAPLSAR